MEPRGRTAWLGSDILGEREDEVAWWWIVVEVGGLGHVYRVCCF